MASSTAKDHLAPTAAQPAPSSSSAEDESRKKNTDCVYFLASPLTCKKGNECEFRHSEYARVNPRDCWYWLNGNCLNPKCSFRHPPLDTLPGPPADGSSVPGSSGFTPVSSLPAVHPAPPTPYAAAKPTVPCIFFQKGYCLKGDLCPFSHIPNPLSKKAPEFHGAASSGFPSFNSTPGELRKCSQAKPVSQPNAPKPIEVTTHQPKANVHAVKALPRNGAFPERHGGPPFTSNGDFPKHKETASLPHSNGNSRNKPSHAPHITALDEPRTYTRKETDDLQRESSPGFDVLVDDELGGSDYFGNEDQFPGIHHHEEGELGEFKTSHPDRYRSLDDIDPVTYHDRYGYDKQEKHARDRRYTPSDSQTKNSDLRSRLLKQRRTDSMSSVVVSGRSDRRDSHGSSLSSRLQGRIKLPPNRLSESEYDKGRSHARLSPTRPHLQPRHGRIQDRLRGRIHDEAPDFSCPRSLVDSRKAEAFNSVGKRKATADDDLSFEAPKPLSEILKRKRKTETTASKVQTSVPEPKQKAKPEANAEDETDSPKKDALLAPTQEDETDDPKKDPLLAPTQEAENDEGLVEDHGTRYEEEEQYEGEGEEGEAYEEGEGGEEEYIDEDDGENFAKKIGVMFG